MIIAAEQMTEKAGGQLVTMYVGSPGLGKGKLPVSEKRKSTGLGLSEDRYNLSGDTNEAIHPFVPRSQDGGLAESRVSENRSPVNKKTMVVLQDLVDTVGVEIPESDKALFQLIGEQGAARLDAANEAKTRIDNLAINRPAFADRSWRGHCAGRIRNLLSALPRISPGAEAGGKSWHLPFASRLFIAGLGQSPKGGLPNGSFIPVPF